MSIPPDPYYTEKAKRDAEQLELLFICAFGIVLGSTIWVGISLILSIVRRFQ